MDYTQYDAFMELAKKRRSTRRFKSDAVPDELILKIIEAGRLAPTAFNTQPAEYFVIKDPRLRARIVEITASYWEYSKDMEKARPAWQGRTWKLKGMTDEKGDYRQAPVYILLCGDPRVRAGLPMGVQCDGHRRRMLYQSSLANTFMYMHLAAASLGLGAQWYSAVQTPYASCLIKDLLNIPPDFDIFELMVLGYPALGPPDKFLRDREEALHWDQCGPDDFRSDEQVRDFVRRTRSWVIGAHAREVKD